MKVTPSPSVLVVLVATAVRLVHLGRMRMAEVLVDLPVVLVDLAAATEELAPVEVTLVALMVAVLVALDREPLHENLEVLLEDYILEVAEVLVEAVLRMAEVLVDLAAEVLVDLPVVLVEMEKRILAAVAAAVLALLVLVALASSSSAISDKEADAWQKVWR